MATAAVPATLDGVVAGDRALGLLVASADIGDPDGTRTVYAIVALLVVLGVALVMVAAWLWRVTRPDPELLAPLELMGDRSWRRGDPVWQRRRLEEVRPEKAAPLSRPIAPPDVDEAFDAGPVGSDFSDLSDVAVPGEPAFGSSGRSADDGDGDGDDARAGTPIATNRPMVDELGESDLDPEMLAQAAAQLDDELRREREDDSSGGAG